MYLDLKIDYKWFPINYIIMIINLKILFMDKEKDFINEFLSISEEVINFT
jgi:hypothetical protein